MSYLKTCPFGVYMKDDVRKPYTSALFTEPKHIHCEHDECALWDEDACSVKKAMLALAGKAVQR